MNKLFDKFKLFENEDSLPESTYTEKVQSKTLDSILHTERVSNPDITSGQVSLNNSNLKDLLDIDTIYQNNNLKDVSNNIFKVEEIKNVLPTNLPIETLRQSVLGMFPVSNLKLEEALADATNRINVLQSTMKEFTNTTINIVQANDLKVKELEAEINKLKEETLTRQKLEEEQTKIISEEITKVTNIVNFINPTKSN